MAEIVVQQNPLPQTAAAHTRWSTPAAVVAATGLVALCAHIAVPLGFTPVPITMQTFAVLLVGLLFAPRAAFASLLLYLAEGAAGLPVFSPHGPGGLMQLLGPSGGYLLSYPLAAALAGVLYRRAFSRSAFSRSAGRGFAAALLAAACASILILAAGATWLGLLTHAKASVVFAQSVAPFLPGDGVKLVAAALCAGALGSFRRAPQGTLSV